MEKTFIDITIFCNITDKLIENFIIPLNKEIVIFLLEINNDNNLQWEHEISYNDICKLGLEKLIIEYKDRDVSFFIGSAIVFLEDSFKIS
ncbi:hypothetical protein [Avibacterium paragallinarum]|uniref:hypothetical protein n=1 Tax=Avibacterium paragallinarum TaxID=728 RepID=UPI00397D7E06